MKRPLLLISVLAIAALAPAQKTYQLRINVKPGQTYKYLLKMRSNLMTVQTEMTMKAVKVQNKLTTFNTTIGKTTMDGRPAPGSEALKKILLITTMDSLGNVVKSEVKGANMGAMPTQSAIPFLAAAVKVGDTWTAQGTVQGQKVNTKYKLVAVKPVYGKMAAVIHAMPSSMAQLQPNGPIVFSVELATGMTISMKMTGQALQADGSKLNVEVTMNRG